jgi:Na+-translocating ferredoxin:NAD+ oxidoreductase RnfA subunit
MMDSLIGALAAFFSLAIIAISIENSVLTRALEISRLISLVDETTNTFIFGILLTTVSTLSSIFYFLFNTYVFYNWPLRIYLRPLAMVICMSMAFFLLFIFVVKFAPYEYLSKSVTALPVATFNCTVIGSLVVSSSSTLGYTLLDSIAYGIGSSIGFVLAVLLVTEGQRWLKSRSIPPAFKGLTATLLFLAGQALAIYGLAGRTVSF